jgi:hypothetical protein
MAVDYRDVNQNIQPFAGTIPDMRSLFPFVVGNEYYAKLDNVAGYYQLPVKEEYQLCEDKKSNILQLGEPRNLKDVRRMLGMVNFIPNLSVLVKPLTDLSADVCLVEGGTEDLAGREGSCGSGRSLA